MTYIETDGYGFGDKSYVNLDQIKVIRIVKITHGIPNLPEGYHVMGFYDYDFTLDISLSLENCGADPLPSYKPNNYKSVTLYCGIGKTFEEQYDSCKRFVEYILSDND